MKTFNENYEINRRARGVKATAKLTAADSPVAEIPPTADGTPYDANQTYHFFDPSTQQVRPSIGLRRDGIHLSTFGLKVVAVSCLHLNRRDALTDGQSFFRAEIVRLENRIGDFENEKVGAVEN